MGIFGHKKHEGNEQEITEAVNEVHVEVDLPAVSSPSAASQENPGQNISNEPNGEQTTFGVAFSGGGIRACSFASGVVCNLVLEGNMKELDYMSCVSGGGYLGSSYVDWCFHHQGKDPKVWIGQYFENMERNIGFLVNWHRYDQTQPWRSIFRGLRDSGNFLLSFVVFLAFVAASFYSYGMLFTMLAKISVEDALLSGNAREQWQVVYLYFLPIICGLYLLRVSLKCYSRLRAISRIRNFITVALFLFILLMCIYMALIYHYWYWEMWQDWLLFIALWACVLAPLILPSSFAGIKADLLVFVGLVLFFARVIASYLYNDGCSEGNTVANCGAIFLDSSDPIEKAFAILGTALLLLNPFLEQAKFGFFHMYYRWRITSSFYYSDTSFGFQGPRMSHLKDIRPQYISTCSVNLWKVQDQDSQTRNWDSFAIYPDRMERINVNDPQPISHGEDMLLGDACAISAGAFAFTMGDFTAQFQTIRPLFVLLGAGLGKWVRTIPISAWKINLLNCLVYVPAVAAVYTQRYFLVLGTVILATLLVLLAVASPASWNIHVSALPIVQSARQIFNFKYRHTNFYPSHVFLSDGAHSENLGVLPLFRMECDKVVIADSASDPLERCNDLIRVVQMSQRLLNCSFFPYEVEPGAPIDPASADFTVSFYNSLSRKKSPDAPRAFPFRVRYASGKWGVVIYIKSRMTPCDVTTPPDYGIPKSDEDWKKITSLAQSGKKKSVRRSSVGVTQNGEVGKNPMLPPRPKPGLVRRALSVITERQVSLQRTSRHYSSISFTPSFLLENFLNQRSESVRTHSESVQTHTNSLIAGQHDVESVGNHRSGTQNIQDRCESIQLNGKQSHINLNILNHNDSTDAPQDRQKADLAVGRKHTIAEDDREHTDQKNVKRKESNGTRNSIEKTDAKGKPGAKPPKQLFREFTPPSVPSIRSSLKGSISEPLTALDEHVLRAHVYKKEELDKLHGCMCECCGSLTCCDGFTLTYPHHSTTNQFVTPSFFRAYHQQGYASMKEANAYLFPLSRG